MEQPSILAKICGYFEQIRNTPLSAFESGDLLKDIEALTPDALECFSKASLPFGLHSLLLVLRQVDTVESAYLYLKQMYALLQIDRTPMGHIFYILNYTLLYLQLIKQGSIELQHKLYALCLLCFDYGRCVA